MTVRQFKACRSLTLPYVPPLQTWQYAGLPRLAFTKMEPVGHTAAGSPGRVGCPAVLLQRGEATYARSTHESSSIGEVTLQPCSASGSEPGSLQTDEPSR